MLRCTSLVVGSRIAWTQPKFIGSAWRRLSVSASPYAHDQFRQQLVPSDAEKASPSIIRQLPVAGLNGVSAHTETSPPRANPVTVAAAQHHATDSPQGVEVAESKLTRTPANLEGVTVVRDVHSAVRAIHQLTLVRDTFIAWDTETTGVDPTKESPVGKGRVICLSAYGGDHIDFGNGPRLFVDCLDCEGGGENMLQLFKEYFEDDRFLKVWHNYSFDRHVLNNHGINVSGFGGDTMHMARLVDTSRKKYSLEELCNDYLDDSLRKAPMKERFGAKRICKDGTEGKDIVVPSTVDLQRSAEHRPSWIEYAVSDAQLTHSLMDVLSTKLKAMSLTPGGNALSNLPHKNMDELYDKLFVPFGNMLIDMEHTGFKVDVSRLLAAQDAAEGDRDRLEDSFRDWVSSHCADARYMNINSGKQKQQLFFAPFMNSKSKEIMPEKQTFKVEQVGIMGQRYAEELALQEMSDDENYCDDGAVAQDDIEGGREKKAKKTPKRPRSAKLVRDVTIAGLGLSAPAVTPSGLPSVNAVTMRKLAGYPRKDPPVYGDARDPEICLAIDDIMEASAVSTLLSGFIVPLQHMIDSEGRIHASLNINTETGRLSSRRPNLQNQPALEKDRYKIRNAFVCEDNSKLIVADYGQLELRLLAHITSCQSMIKAFAAGGDFHSRTALTMYDHVAEAVRRGDCLLERDADDKEAATAPLLKDMYATERRRAKTLNFSIAYGKTAVGLSNDWGISREEAEETLSLWYKDRPEVRKWQEDCRQFAREHGFVETILGRRRHLPEVRSSDYRERGHALRAAINAPLQGSAADLVMVAMLKLHKNATLRALGWRVILQVHDEILFEGPTESAEIAREVIRDVMLHPFEQSLSVAMTVDPSIADSWYNAK